MNITTLSSSPKRSRDSDDDHIDADNDVEDYEIVSIINTSSMINNNEVNYTIPLKLSPKRTKVIDLFHDREPRVDSNVNEEYMNQLLSTSSSSIAQLPSNQNNQIMSDPNDQGFGDVLESSYIQLSEPVIHDVQLEPQLFNYPHLSTIESGAPRLGSFSLLHSNKNFLEKRKEEYNHTSNNFYPPTIPSPPPFTVFTQREDILVNENQNITDCYYVQLGPLCPLPRDFLLNPRSYWPLLQSRGWYTIETPTYMRDCCYIDIDDEYLKKRFNTHLFLRRGEPRILQAGDEYIEKVYETSEMSYNLFNQLFKEDICFPSEECVINYCRSLYGIRSDDIPVHQPNTTTVHQPITTILSYLFDPNVEHHIPN